MDGFETKIPDAVIGFSDEIKSQRASDSNWVSQDLWSLAETTPASRDGWLPQAQLALQAQLRLFVGQTRQFLDQIRQFAF